MAGSESNREREGQLIMPFYIACDVSGSMVKDMADLQAGLDELRNEVMREVIVAELVMLSVITFNHAARTLVPLGAPHEITIPGLPPASGTTSYSAAFRQFHEAFQADLGRYHDRNVYRPCIFFLTDGEPDPDDNYQRTFQSLLAYDKASEKGNPQYPYVCAFGFRDATRASMESLAYPTTGPEAKLGRWFIAREGHKPGELLRAIGPALADSVVQSGLSALDGTPVVQLPTSMPGMIGGSVVHRPK